MGRLAGRLVACAGVALAGCTLLTNIDGLVGGTPVDAGGGSSSDVVASGVPEDASLADSILQDVGAIPVDACGTQGCFDMPTGFALVALGPKGGSCPSGFTLPADTVEGPNLGANACTCGCSVTNAPSCATGAIVGAFGTAGGLTCPNAGGNLVNTGCGTDGFLGPFGTGNEHKYTPPAASGGSCSASAVKDTAKLTYAAERRVCQASVVPQCNGKTCPPTVGGSFSVCIAATGDVPCPLAFPTKHLVGTGASFNCSAGCTCGVTANCSGRLDYFASANCSGTAAYSIAVNNTCVATDNGGASYASHIYVANAPTQTACTKTGSTTPSTPALSGPVTTCCN